MDATPHQVSCKVLKGTDNNGHPVIFHCHVVSLAKGFISVKTCLSNIQFNLDGDFKPLFPLWFSAKIFILTHTFHKLPNHHLFVLAIALACLKPSGFLSRWIWIKPTCQPCCWEFVFIAPRLVMSGCVGRFTWRVGGWVGSLPLPKKLSEGRRQWKRVE